MLSSLLTGDKNGWISISPISIKRHYRPIIGDIGARIVVQFGLLDHVFSNMGTYGNDGIFQHFQLRYS